MPLSQFTLAAEARVCVFTVAYVVVSFAKMVHSQAAELQQLYCFACNKMKVNMEKLPVALLVC